MSKQSAGILLYRKADQIEVLLVHPGGPFFSRKDLAVWSVPKGEYEEAEDPFQAALREFQEETGQQVRGDFVPLDPVKQRSGKVVTAWAVEGNMDATNIVSNYFEMIWPPKSQQIQSFPEVDRADWFPLELAREKINPGQIPLLDQLEKILRA
jgi:predicted NUDIX family NTP pyrophosphohydrolase